MTHIEIIPESIKLIKMTDEEYFSSKYDKYTSNSKLALLNPLQGGSITKYKAGYKSSYSPSFELGSAVHGMLLQPHDFVISPLSKPSGKLGEFVLAVYKARRKNISLEKAINIAKKESDYYVNSLTPNRIKTAIKSGLSFYIGKLKEDKVINTTEQILYLSDAIREKFIQCIDSAKKDVKLMGKLNPDHLVVPVESFNEYAIFCDLKITIDSKEHIIPIKCKIDNFTIDHELGIITLNDLKTTGRPVSYFMGNYVPQTDELGVTKKVWMNGSFQKYHYHRQMGLYFWLLSSAIKHIYDYDYDLKANMLLVETIPPFNTRVCPINGVHIKKGLDEFKKLIIYLIENE